VPAVALTALPLLLVAVAGLLAAVAVARSLRDEAVLDALRTEARAVGEVHRAVREVRASRTGRPSGR
jgi:hypothetical protein